MNIESGITRFSPAKINLTLAVGPVRPDGFHPLESIVSLLNFGDTVTLIPRSDDAIVIECDTPGIPTDDTNLAARAARRLREEVAGADGAGGARGASVSGVTIRLEKQIPAGAGLGGGSSNAAATLLGLKKLWKLDIPAPRFAAIGAELGSDVPLFLAEPERLIVMRGRGEKIELLDHSLLAAHVLLAIPPIHSPTGGVYKRFDELPAPPKHPSAHEALAVLPHSTGFFNDLQPAAEDLNPQLREFRTTIESITARAFMMTGSGAAYFTIFPPSEGVAAGRTYSKLRTSDGAGKFVLARLI